MGRGAPSLVRFLRGEFWRSWLLELSPCVGVSIFFEINCAEKNKIVSIPSQMQQF